MRASIRRTIVPCPRLKQHLLIAAYFAGATLLHVAAASAAITSTGDVAPNPAGGNVAGPLRVGINDVGTMNISGGTPLTNTSNAIVGDTATGLGIVTMSGFLSDWTLPTSGADLTVGNFGTGSISLANLAFMNVEDDLFMAVQLNSLGEAFVSDLGTIWVIGDDTIIGERGQAVITIANGGRMLSDQNTLGDLATGDARVTVTDDFSLWRTTSTMTVGDAGRALLQVFDGGRVENTSAGVGNSAGSTGTVEVAGIGALWQNSLGLSIGEFGNGLLIISDGGRVTTGGGANLTTIGRQVGAIGHVEVRGLDSLFSVGGAFEVGDSGDGTLRVLEAGRVTSAGAILGDNAGSRGEALVDGVGSSWQITGELLVSDPGEAHLTIADGGLVRSSLLTRVATLGRLTLDGGRLEAGGTGLTNTGVVVGNGVIEGNVTNNAGGQIRLSGPGALVLLNTLTNSSLIDIQTGELEVFGATTNNADIDARDGAILRFRSTGLDNNSGSQLAITSGIVDVFGLVDNNVGAEIVIGGTALGVFHDAVTNNGTIFIQPGGEVLMLENLGFGGGATVSLQLRDVDLTEEGTDPSDAFGQVQVAGPASLGGTLEVELLGGYMPMAGDSFQIITAGGGRSGVFATESLPPLAAGLNWDVLYGANSVVLAVIGPGGLTGDYNDDGAVDAADYVVWRKELGSPEAYNLWRANFGEPGGGSGSGGAILSQSAVPEPTCLFLCGVGCIAFLTFARRSPACGGKKVSGTDS